MGGSSKDGNRSGSSTDGTHGTGGTTGPGGVPGKPVYGNLPTVATMQPHFPGAIEAIMAQLGQGYGNVPTFADLYRPMQMVTYKEPISSTQAALADKKKDATKYAAPLTGIPTLDAILSSTSSDKHKKGGESR